MRTDSRFGDVRLPTVDTRDHQYQDVKSRVHEQLLNRLNLERLSKISRLDAEPEIRTLILGILERESSDIPLSLYEREALIGMLVHDAPQPDDPLDRIRAAPGEVPALHSDAGLYTMWFLIVGLLVAGGVFGIWAVFFYRPL